MADRSNPNPDSIRSVRRSMSSILRNSGSPEFQQQQNHLALIKPLTSLYNELGRFMGYFRTERVSAASEIEMVVDSRTILVPNHIARIYYGLKEGLGTLEELVEAGKAHHIAYILNLLRGITEKATASDIFTQLFYRLLHDTFTSYDALIAKEESQSDKATTSAAEIFLQTRISSLMPHLRQLDDLLLRLSQDPNRAILASQLLQFLKGEPLALLDLSGCDLNKADIVAIAYVLVSSPLLQLHIANNPGISGDGISVLAKALSSASQSALQALDLSGIDLSTLNISALVNALTRDVSQVQRLGLSQAHHHAFAEKWLSKNPERVITKLDAEITESTSSSSSSHTVPSLFLGDSCDPHVSITVNPMVVEAKFVLQQLLARLDAELLQNRTAIAELTRFINAPASCQKLSLASCGLSTAEVKSIALLLPHSGVATLALDGNKDIDVEGITALAQTFPRASTLRTVTLYSVPAVHSAWQTLKDAAARSEISMLVTDGDQFVSKEKTVLLQQRSRSASSIVRPASEPTYSSVALTAASTSSSSSSSSTDLRSRTFMRSQHVSSTLTAADLYLGVITPSTSSSSLSSSTDERSSADVTLGYQGFFVRGYRGIEKTLEDKLSAQPEFNLSIDDSPVPTDEPSTLTSSRHDDYDWQTFVRN